MKGNPIYLVFPILVAVLLALAANLVLGCTSSEPDGGPSSEELAVIGTWAGQVDAQGVPLLLILDLQPSHAYQVDIEAAAAAVERERGAWAVRGGRLVTTPATCESADQVGGPLHLVTCTGPDSVAVNIAGDTWTLHFTAGGELVTFQLKRL